MAIARIGRYNTGSDPDAGIVSADTQRAFVIDPITQTLIVYSLGGHIGRATGTTVTGRFGIGDVTSGNAPGDRLGYTSTFSASTAMSYGGDGAVYERDLTSPVLCQSGNAYSLVVTAPGASLYHGMIQAASNGSKDNQNFYDKTNTSSIPTNPIGGSAHYEGWLTLWATGEVQVAPNVPTGIAPAGTLVSTDVTPQMVSSFSDDNENLPNGGTYDELTYVQIKVRRKSDSVSFWDSGALAATSTEKANRQANKTYAGTTLVPGVTYQQQVRHKDKAGSWSAYSVWVDFTINAGGTVVTTASTPTGKQNSQTPGPFVAAWNHPNPLNTNAAIVRIRDASNNVLQTMSQASPYVTSVASGGNISVPWANTGFTALARGGNGYKWQMQARDTGNAWSPWSASVAFSVNATPNTPSSLSPTGSTAVTSAPKLSASVTDPDDIATAVTTTIQILRADGTSVTRTMTYNATTKKYEYQTVIGTNEVQQITPGGTISGGTFTVTVPANVRGAQTTSAPINWNDTASQVQTKLEAMANVGAGRVSVTGGPISSAALTITFLMELSATDLSQITVTSSLTGTAPTITPSTVTAGVNGDWAGFQTLQWRARSSDGTSTSAFSAYATFLYGAGPAVTVTAPLDEASVTTGTYQLTWTVPSGGPQAKYRVQATEVDAFDVPVPNGYSVDTGDVVSTNQFHTLTGLRNGRRYTIVVTVTNATPLSGSSQPQQFNVAFTPPEALTGFTATPTSLQSATGSDAILLGWDYSTRPSDQFGGYDIYRRALGPAEGIEENVSVATEIAAGRVHLRHIDEALQIAFVDGTVASGASYEYEITQTVIIGLDSLTSISSTAIAAADIDHVVLTAALEPETYGIELRHKSGRGAFLKSALQQDKKKARPVGARKGRTIASPFLSWNDSGTFELVSSRFATADEQIRRMHALVERGGTLCLRDFLGLKRYVSLDGYTEQRISRDRFVIDLSFSEEWFAEGEE